LSERFPEERIPSEGVSEKPIKTKPQFSKKQANPTPFPIFTFSGYVTHSENPDEANPHKQ